MTDFHYPIWSIWPELGWRYRAFWLLLSTVSTYMLFSIAGIWLRLRSRRIQGEGESISSFRGSLVDLEHRLRNVRQSVGAACYLFGLFFFIQFPRDIWMTETGRLSLIMAILRTLSLNLAFGANVFFVLLVLHSAQWFVSARVSAALRHAH